MNINKIPIKKSGPPESGAPPILLFKKSLTSIKKDDKKFVVTNQITIFV